MDRDFQGLRGNNDLREAQRLDAMDRDFQLPRGNNDLREAQRLAASFFSSQILPSGSNSGYRDVRPNRVLSSEPSAEGAIDRFGSQSSRHYRERDANDEQRWASSRSTSQERYHSSRNSHDLGFILPDSVVTPVYLPSVLMVGVKENEFWDDVDPYGVSGNRKVEDNYGWEEVDAEYAARKKSEYSVHGEAEPHRVIKRVDWTGMFRDGRDVGASDSSVGRRSGPVYGSRQFGEVYLGGQDDLMDPEEAVFSSRTRDPIENLRKGRGYVDEVPDTVEPEYGLVGYGGAARNVSRGGPQEVDWSRDAGAGAARVVSRGGPQDIDWGRGASAGTARSVSRGGPQDIDWGRGGSAAAARGVSRAGPQDIDWGRDVRRHEDRDFWQGGMRSSGLNELNEIPRGFPDGHDGPVTFPPNRANPPVARRGMINPKPDYSVRANLTNRDILGIYYGNSSHHLRKDFPRRGGVAFERSDRLHYGPPGPWHGPSRPLGSFNRERDDWGPMQKGKKRWPSSSRAGENPHISHTSHGKRFKRETEADKLFLIHNSKATSASLSESREKGKDKEERITPVRDDSNKETELEEKASEKGLWDESWSDSEEDNEAGGNASPKEEIGPTVEDSVKEDDEEVGKSGRPAGFGDPDENAGDRPLAADDDADWESLATDMEDQVDGKSGKQSDETEVSTSKTNGNAVVGIDLSTGQSKQPNSEEDDVKIIENEVPEMLETDGKVDGARVDSSGESMISEGGGPSSEKNLAFEVPETGNVKEDKAYEFYLSCFERNADLKKLYENNTASGSYECLVCAGVGAKKKKRFPDVASMVQHAKKIIKTKKLPEHRGFARAVCHILGWDSTLLC